MGPGNGRFSQKWRWSGLFDAPSTRVSTITDTPGQIACCKISRLFYMIYIILF
jgi:hypothetical protein